MGVQIQGDTGNVIATKGTYSGDVSIGGTLTYEDVTNIDSVGLITARTGIEIGARPGVAASISVDGNMIVSGISTFGGDVHVADKIIHDGDTNTSIRFPEADHISFETAGSEAIRIDDAGKLLKGLTDRRLFAAGTTSSVQIEGLSASGSDASSLSIVNNQNGVGSPSIRLGKTRGTSIGSNTSVADGDNLGQIFFYGADGTDIYNATAMIGAKVNGTVGTDTIPTDLVFQTSATTTASRTERLRILSSGGITFNGDTATANALDDYEEGTWTPDVSTGTITSQSAIYTKIGRLVNISARIETFSNRTSANNVSIGGLPFAVQDATNMGSSVFYRVANTDDGHIGAMVTGSDKVQFLVSSQGGSETWFYIKHTDLNNNNTQIRFNVWYITAA